MAISVLLTVAGILFVAYGLYSSQALREALQTGAVKEAWDMLTYLFLLFLFGYTAFLGYLLLDVRMMHPDLVAALVFFIGAVYLALAAHVNRSAFGRGAG